jgi:AGZA family xanthine/uracil permease-like MFS transporter
MKRRWFVRGDLDGFFGLFIDNLLQLMLINVLCRYVCNLPADLVTQRILPGAAISILCGNLFYGWQAFRLMRQTGRDDVTALPYGINTPSLIAYVLLIMAPIYHQTQNATLAWQAGLVACFLSGIIEAGGAAVADWLRRNTPRAALLSALAGIAITFIAMGFIFQMFAMPRVALIPMFIILVAYAAHVRFPLGLPGGLIAVAAGVLTAWGLRWCGVGVFEPLQDPTGIGFYPPRPVPGDLLELLTRRDGWAYMSVIFPMGLFNLIGSLQNLESAEAAGDRYPTRSSLLMNGFGSMLGALFGSPFPTTIYIGHPAWKAMGARAGYSIVNGIVIAILCLIGGVTIVLRFIPIESTLAILLWIGIIITAQAFQAVPKRHALAVAFGLIPSLAAWAFYLVEQTAHAAGVSLMDVVGKLEQNGLYLTGVFALNQGFLISAMMLSAILAHIIDRRLFQAGCWTLATAGLSFFGLIHAYELTPLGLRNVFGLNAAPPFSVAYFLGAIILLVLHRWQHGGVLNPDSGILSADPMETPSEATVNESPELQ